MGGGNKQSSNKTHQKTIKPSASGSPTNITPSTTPFNGFLGGGGGGGDGSSRGVGRDGRIGESGSGELSSEVDRDETTTQAVGAAVGARLRSVDRNVQRLRNIRVPKGWGNAAGETTGAGVGGLEGGGRGGAATAPPLSRPSELGENDGSGSMVNGRSGGGRGGRGGVRLPPTLESTGVASSNTDSAMRRRANLATLDALREWATAARGAGNGIGIISGRREAQEDRDRVGRKDATAGGNDGGGEASAPEYEDDLADFIEDGGKAVGGEEEEAGRSRSGGGRRGRGGSGGGGRGGGPSWWG